MVMITESGIKKIMYKGFKDHSKSIFMVLNELNNFYINFVQDVYSLQASNNNRFTLDTLLLLKREMNFINYSFHIDTLKIASHNKFSPPIRFFIY